MLKNYLLVGIRNLIKNKGYSTINILGLSLGIACCLILFIIVRFELSFDNFHANKDRIYRVVTNFQRSEGLNHNPGAPVPMHEALKTDMPDLEQVAITRYEGEGNIVLADNEQKKFKEEHIGYVNQEYFNIIKYEWMAGNPTKVLTAPNKVTISEAIAEKYFQGIDNALGKIIRLNNKHDLEITGVFRNLPVNTDFPFNILVSYPTVRAQMEAEGEWGSVSSNIQHFVLLPDKSRTEAFDERLKSFSEKYHDEEEARTTSYTFQPLSTIHFDTRYGNFLERVSTKETLWALSAIGLFMIITACINFINLATAQAVKRSKEVGVRKVLGSSRFQLSAQFLGETSFITLLALVIAMILVDFTLPYINQIMDLKLDFSPFSDLVVVLLLFGLLIVVSALSGFYPSIVLSGFKPVDAIKNKIGTKNAGAFTLRRSLVVLQFVISQVLIIGTIVVTNQLQYFKSKDIGFKRDAIITFPLPENESNQLARLKENLQNTGEIESVTFSISSPSSGSRWIANASMKDSETKDVFPDIKIADENYLETYGLPLLAGRFIAKSDTIREAVVNETFLRKFGIQDPNEALGREIKFWTDYYVPIVGVVKDFHTLSLHEEITPMVISTDRETYLETAVKIKTSNISAALADIEKAWTAVYPAYVFDYEFLDDRLGEFYVREARLNKMFQIFAGIAIFIGCLGLYGLVSFMAVQKTKEIGIRKVMGASVSNILLLFSKEFTRLVMIAFCFAAPISYYVMSNWLQDFTYKIEMGIGVFLLAILASLSIAWLTVGYKAIHAAIANPIKSLKTE